MSGCRGVKIVLGLERKVALLAGGRLPVDEPEARLGCYGVGQLVPVTQELDQEGLLGC